MDKPNRKIGKTPLKCKVMRMRMANIDEECLVETRNDQLAEIDDDGDIRLCHRV